MVRVRERLSTDNRLQRYEILLNQTNKSVKIVCFYTFLALYVRQQLDFFFIINILARRFSQGFRLLRFQSFHT